MYTKTINYLLLLCFCAFLTSCANKVERTTLGDDETLFGNGINIHTELEPAGLMVTISNLYNTPYSLWINYKYNCENKRGNNEEQIYYGSDTYKTILIAIPKAEANCKKSFVINLKDDHDKDLYFSHLLEIKPTTLHSEGGTKSLGD